MRKHDIPGGILRGLQVSENRRLRADALSAPVVWVAVIVVLVAKAHDWKTAGVELAIGLVPFAVGGFLWWRHRRADLEEAERVRSPLNLP
ncbi:MAG TPA: hypothetical protein VGF50_01760 [Caulobacteraceae bacterium]|jgi:hypothetical protein